jgi:hypothetical protein
MKKTIILGIGLLLSSKFMKSQNDYVLSLAKDTIKVNVINWDNSRVFCEVNGIKTKYKAKEIIEFRAGQDYYEVAKICATLIGFKRPMFLQRVLTGKINLYGIGVTDHFSSSNSVGSTTIKEHKSVSVTVGFVRKTTDPTGKYKKLFSYSKVAKMTKDCDVYNKKFAAGVSKWDYPYAMQIDYYNQHCK